MNTSILRVTVFAAAFLLTAGMQAQQPQSAQPAPAAKLEFPQPSPAVTVKQRVGLTDIEVVYSRPSAKGRTIFGALVPWGELWRTGANAATKISFSTDVKVNGQPVPAGAYSLFTIPGETEWTVILNKVADQSGTSTYDAKNDLARLKVAPVALTDPVESMRIWMDSLSDESAELSIAWERTAVPVRIETDVEAMLVPRIKAAMAAEGTKPWYQAAMFYYEHDLDLPLAAQWMEEAVKERPDTVWLVYRQGLILAKAGDKEGALAAARRSLELADKTGGAQGAEYKRLNEQLIASLQ